MNLAGQNETPDSSRLPEKGEADFGVIKELLAPAFTSFDGFEKVTLRIHDDRIYYAKGKELPFLTPTVLDFHIKTLLPFYVNGTRLAHCGDSYGDVEVLRAATLFPPNTDCRILYNSRRALDFGMLRLPEEGFTAVRELLASVSNLAIQVPSTEADDFRCYGPEDQPCNNSILIFSPEHQLMLEVIVKILPAALCTKSILLKK